MAEDTTVSNGYTFRGVEYTVTMVTESDSCITVEVEEKHASDQWRASFDAPYIEDLTHKTGNYKQFQIFVNMLESAIIQNSDSVSLDLLTYSDLESLRSRKTGTTSSKHIPAASRNPSLNSKRYLILTYTVEFDRIHYPLPLPYMGKPDPHALQDTIRQLRDEIKILKQKETKDHKSKELNKLKRDYGRVLREKEELEASFLEFRREVQHTTVGSAAKEIRVLKDLVKAFEEDLVKEQTKHQRSASRRSQEYRQLLDEVDEVKASERNLKARVKSLTNELAIYKRRTGSSRTTTSSVGRRQSTLSNGLSSCDNSYSKDNSRLSKYSQSTTYSRNRSLERSRDRSLSRERPSFFTRERSRLRERPTSSYLRDRSSSRERPVSRDRSASRDRFRANSSGSSVGSKNSRSRGQSPFSVPKFDPTAYVKEKQRKNNETELKQKRNNKSRMSGSFEKRPPSYSNRSSERYNRGSRASSVSSLRSRTSSLESLSDVGIASDTSDGRLRKTTKVLKTTKALNAWSSPDVSYNSKSNGKPPANKTKKVLSSTPEKSRTRTKLRGKENIINSDAGGDSDYFDRSTEIGEIDARLNRLQQFMKNNL